MSDRILLFVCAHGAARSRIAAAWFNANPPDGWHATTAAGEQPADALNPAVEPLLAGTPAHAHLDRSPPVALHTVDDVSLVVAIDCAVPNAYWWDLDATEVDQVMRDELRDRIVALTRTLHANPGRAGHDHRHGQTNQHRTAPRPPSRQ